MKKYIRTKDGIYDTQRLTKNNGFLWKGDVRWGKIITDEKLVENVINKADTIEELCDEFVIEYENGHHIVYGELEWAKDKALRSGKKYIIYGAIWTDKGLIYVAKTNDEGVLELI